MSPSTACSETGAQEEHPASPPELLLAQAHTLWPKSLLHQAAQLAQQEVPLPSQGAWGKAPPIPSMLPPQALLLLASALSLESLGALAATHVWSSCSPFGPEAAPRQALLSLPLHSLPGFYVPLPNGSDHLQGAPASHRIRGKVERNEEICTWGTKMRGTGEDLHMQQSRGGAGLAWTQHKHRLTRAPLPIR